MHQQHHLHSLDINQKEIVYKIYRLKTDIHVQILVYTCAFFQQHTPVHLFSNRYLYFIFLFAHL